MIFCEINLCLCEGGAKSICDNGTAMFSKDPLVLRVQFYKKNPIILSAFSLEDEHINQVKIHCH